MTCSRPNSRTLRLLLCSAVATAALTGCAQSVHLSRAAVSQPAVAKAQGSADATVATAEQVVAQSPQDAASRAALGGAYLAAGRFDSAATSFHDAMQLGDDSPRTALSLALAEIGGGHGQEAAQVLEQHRDSIPASDLGLALALAGKADEGVTILGDALRGGEDTPKLRQNLAYAYALDGRWNEARIMAAQDVPADQLDARITQWAMQGKPEDYQLRIASLIGAPVRADSGQPQYLALGGAPSAASTPKLASAAAELPAAPSAPADPQPLASADPAPADAAPPFKAAATADLSAAGSARQFETAFAGHSSGLTFVSKPVVEALLQRPQPLSRPAATGASVIAEGANRTHLVQLGSFSSESGAQRAWAIFQSRNPELRKHDLKIVPAIVHGRKYWRVAATGFDRTGAAGMCSTVKGRGGGCFAFAANHPLPGALPMNSEVRMAQR
jgi:tetratricopeptide (TPR) repeat protein